ncbi:MAG: hypothetical protein RLZ80_555, partial [Actinomycetota bacterium]
KREEEEEEEEEGPFQGPSPVSEGCLCSLAYKMF